MNIAILLVGGVCIAYTTLGGIRAVIWTDVWQGLWMLSGFVGILAMAGVDFEDFGNILDIAQTPFFRRWLTSEFFGQNRRQ